jgi:ABC-type cobalamin/Fe3+-siderophores transport system ATPase subunit
MRIKEIKIEGFKSPTITANIKFKHKISILYGLNGSGKTTVLKIIHAILAQNEEILIRENVNKVTITITDSSDVENKIKLSFNNKEKKYNWTEIDSSELSKSKSLLIGVQRGIQVNTSTLSPSLIYEFLVYSNISRDVFKTSTHDKSKMRFLADELANFANRHRTTSRRTPNKLIPEGQHITLEDVNIEIIEESLRAAFNNVKRKISLKIYNALFETFALAIDDDKISEIVIPVDIIDIVRNNQEKLIEALEDSPENEFKHLVIEKVKEFSNSSNAEMRTNKLFSKLLLKIVEELEHEKEELGTLNILIELFNSLLSDKKKIIIDREGIKVTINNNTHSLNQLSSGERHLLTFLATILLDGQNRDFILIDEPEISLNILWQEKLIELIHRMAPNTQLIVASHSQSIAENHLQSLTKIEKNFN